jgi:hypothetical protein
MQTGTKTLHCFSKKWRKMFFPGKLKMIEGDEGTQTNEKG